MKMYLRGVSFVEAFSTEARIFRRGKCLPQTSATGVLNVQAVTFVCAICVPEIRWAVPWCSNPGSYRARTLQPLGYDVNLAAC